MTCTDGEQMIDTYAWCCISSLRIRVKSLAALQISDLLGPKLQRQKPASARLSGFCRFYTTRSSTLQHELLTGYGSTAPSPDPKGGGVKAQGLKDPPVNVAHDDCGHISIHKRMLLGCVCPVSPGNECVVDRTWHAASWSKCQMSEKAPVVMGCEHSAEALSVQA